MTAPSRRELNRARTRDALIAAVIGLTRERGIDAVTVEEIAEHAGVSRRTFFNYFTGIDAALAEAVRLSISGVAEVYLARPEDEDPLSAAIVAMTEVPLDKQLLSWIVAATCHDSDLSARAGQLWQYHRDWLADLIAERVGSAADPFYCRALAATVMSIFETTEDIWLATRSHDQLATTSLSDDQVAEFNDLLQRGLSMARDGWPHTSATDGRSPSQG